MLANAAETCFLERDGGNGLTVILLVLVVLDVVDLVPRVATYQADAGKLTAYASDMVSDRAAS